MHNRKSNRLKEYDYSQGGYFFITTCIKDRKDILGVIDKGNCRLNRFGNLVKDVLLELPKRFSYIEIDYYVVMPDHVHFIIIIDPSESKKQKIKSLSEIIGAFKTMSSKQIHLGGLEDFRWQRSFYDRIIRNEKELFLIRRYIEQNPLRLEIAREFPDNLDL